jgi:hypothetical protein
MRSSVLHGVTLAFVGIAVGFGMSALLEGKVSDPVFYGIGAVLVVALVLAHRHFASRFADPS